MFQILKEPRMDFMSRGTLLLTVSGVLALVSLGIVLIHGLNLGIEFTGGTELQLKYADAPDVGQIRSALERAGLASTLVTTIGDPDEHEIYIRLATTGGLSESEEHKDLTRDVLQALRGQAPGAEGRRNDLNLIDEAGVAALLQEAPGLTAAQGKDLAKAVAERRKRLAILHSLDELADVPGMTPDVLEFLGSRTVIGPMALRSQSYIGPAIGRELVRKAAFAIGGSLLGMLVYIWMRFQFQWGLAAVIALVHDTLITLGLFSLLGKEMSLPVVAAFLTLIGYSVNDTVVIFDRVRENIRLGMGGDFATVINQSLNQTLSRTIITSGLTWMVVFALYLFGGAALNAFAFVLAVGIIVGSYSTLYIASPFLILYSKLLDRRKRGPSTAQPAPARQAKKVRTSSSERG